MIYHYLNSGIMLGIGGGINNPWPWGGVMSTEEFR